MYAFINIPGTTLPFSDDNAQAFSVIRRLISATGGFQLSQVCSITGLESSTIQNWVKRGWIGGSLKSKKYDESQVARIIIINALRAALSLEEIAKLLRYINGVVSDKSDDIIEEGELFTYMVSAAERLLENASHPETAVRQVLTDYEGSSENTARLARALEIMAESCVSTELIARSKFALAELF